MAEIDQRGSLRSHAVAIDPPPEGAMGIRELLERFESFTQTDDMIDPPSDGASGVRDLLSRLETLAETGYFSSSEADDPGESEVS